MLFFACSRFYRFHLNPWSQTPASCDQKLGARLIEAAIRVVDKINCGMTNWDKFRVVINDSVKGCNTIFTEKQDVVKAGVSRNLLLIFFL